MSFDLRPRATIDFETRSACSIKDCGSWIYSLHPSTEVMCLAIILPYWEHGRVELWHPAYPHLGIKEEGAEFLRELFAYLEGDDALVEAHNAFFEIGIWRNICEPLLGWPALDLRKVRCSAAKAAVCSLPRDLLNLCVALDVAEKKDDEGKKVMLRLCKPRKARKAERQAPGFDPTRLLYHESVEDFQKLWAYCKQDTKAEHAASLEMPDLSEDEQAVWFMDLEMNLRGIRADVPMARGALKIAEQYCAALNAELKDMTGVESATSRIKVREWVNEQGVALPDTTAATIDKFTKLAGLRDDVKRVLHIVKEVNQTSTSKYKAAILQASPGDDRLRGQVIYHGAGTGRWCLPGETEVLTQEGWVRIDEWTGGKIAQWSPEGTVRFAAAHRVDFPYEGDMVRIKTVRNELLCTPDHKIPTIVKASGRLHPVEAGDMRTNGKRHLPLAGHLVEPPEGWAPEAHTRAIVMFQADGNINIDERRGTAYTSYRLGFTKQRKIDRCRALLLRLGIEFDEFVEQSGLKATRFVIYEKHAPEWLKEAKQFGPWLLRHDPCVFVDELKHWDGHSDKRYVQGGTEYGSCNLENALWAQTMAHLAGTTASVKLRTHEEPLWQDYYRVYVHGDKTGGVAGLRTGCTFEREAFSGRVYCAATETGYFLVRYHGTVQVTGNTGKGLQPHNFKKPKDYIVAGEKKFDIYIAAGIIREGDLRFLVSMYGPDCVMEVLSGAVRGVMIASEGSELCVADFAAIEARCVLWLARQMSALRVFEEGKCIYCDMATGLYGYEVVKGVHGDERQFGKQAILGLGFQMGFATFLITCAKYDIRFTDEMARRVVGEGYGDLEEQVHKYYENKKLGKQRAHKLRYGTKTAPGLDQDWQEVVHELVLMKYTTNKYRERYPEVAAMWDDQETAAIAAVRTPGRVVEVKRGRNAYLCEGRFLMMILPSGRRLYYPEPRIVAKPVPWDPNERRPELRFMTSLPGGGWVPTGTYGGMLVENLTQATARDLMAQAMVRIDAHPKYQMLMSVHDEAIAECPKGTGDVREFERLMAETPGWAKGCPVDAEGWIGYRYKK